jgi:PAS domain S-box-containing protein
VIVSTIVAPRDNEERCWRSNTLEAFGISRSTRSRKSLGSSSVAKGTKWIDWSSAMSRLTEQAQEQPIDRRRWKRRRPDVTATEILENMPDGFMAFDAEWRITYVNGAAEQINSAPRESLLGRNHWEAFPATVGTIVERALRRAMAEQVAVRFENFYESYGRWFEVDAYPLLSGGLAVYGRDVTVRKRIEEQLATDRKEAEDALRRAHEELEQAEEARNALVRRLFAAQEDERRRISREMHDDFGQQLSALTLKLAALKREYAGDATLGDQLASLGAIVKQLDSNVDLFAWQLRPVALDDLDLGAALANYVKMWSEQVEVHAEMHVSGMEASHLTHELDIALYRVMQEALNNVAKHARARNVAVVLQRRSDHVSLIVEDDGAGFDTEQAFDGRDKRLGLVGMRERVALLGGTIDVESQPGHGTTVIARIPAASERT